MKRQQYNNVQKWITALRSGDYEQTTEVLRGDVGFCCLGVACDIHAKETKMEWSDDRSYMQHLTDLPEEVVEFYGLPFSKGILVEILNNSNPVDLTILNDNYGYSFSMIADELANWIDNERVED